MRTGNDILERQRVAQPTEVGSRGGEDAACVSLHAGAGSCRRGGKNDSSKAARHACGVEATNRVGHGRPYGRFDRHGGGTGRSPEQVRNRLKLGERCCGRGHDRLARQLRLPRDRDHKQAAHPAGRARRPRMGSRRLDSVGQERQVLDQGYRTSFRGPE